MTLRAFKNLPLVQRFLFMLVNWREQIFDHAAGAGLDLDGDSHAGGEVDEAVVDLHLGLVEGDLGHVDELLALGLAGFILSAGLLLVFR